MAETLRIDENFEGTGYEESWSETVDGSSTLDEDASRPGTPLVGSGAQCLKAEITSTDANAYAVQTKTDNNVNYVSCDFYLDVERLADNEGFIVIGLYNSADLACALIQAVQSTGALTLRLAVYTAGSLQYTGLSAINIQQWYRIELKYRTSGMTYSWRIDEVLRNSGTLSAAVRTPQKTAIGIMGHTAGTGTTRVYLDQVIWNLERYSGFAYRRLLSLHLRGDN